MTADQRTEIIESIKQDLLMLDNSSLVDMIMEGLVDLNDQELEEFVLQTVEPELVVNLEPNPET